MAAATSAITFVVGGEDFRLQKPFLAIHSPVWRETLASQPNLSRVELPGDAIEFRAFLSYLHGQDGAAVTAANVNALLFWGKEFGIDYLPAACEHFLVGKLRADGQSGGADELLEVAIHHDMPHLYARALEVTAQTIGSVVVPDSAADSDSNSRAVFALKAVREDIVHAHVAMGVMRGDGERRLRRGCRDLPELDPDRQRSRLIWQTRSRFREAPAPPQHDWRSVQTVWPHHSLRGSDWTVVPAETQPAAMGARRMTPRRRKLVA
mmetsp:Transcript_51151/g.121563  ORF Transcript_51151/g.121563 Transcript_51151/m.121563 type:complete len:265 (+) Transcript_51151:61-855(+)